MTVHVLARPEKPVEHGQRVCVHPDGGEEVVFHLNVAIFVNGGERMCLACGYIAWKKGRGAKNN